jgi:BRCT domain type II-containing protein
MPITFDTLEELKAFYQAFSLNETGTSHKQSAITIEAETDQTQRLKRGKKTGSSIHKEASIVKLPLKHGPKPANANKASEPKPKRDKSNTLTAKIQNAIRGFLNANNSFTANDIYAILAKKDAAVNKQSVITSVLKQMNSTFSEISVTERAGNGPRPVKLYNA